MPTVHGSCKNGLCHKLALPNVGVSRWRGFGKARTLTRICASKTRQLVERSASRLDADAVLGGVC
jgi:hypothetical protein